MFGRFFSSGSLQRDPEPTSTRSVATNAYSQPHVLQQRMKEEALTHGQTVVADISPVRLEITEEKTLLYFCPLRSIDVVQSVTCGDGGSIPAEVQVEGLTIDENVRSGLYTLRNVVLTSNGSIQVKATEKTTWEKV